MQLLLGGVKLTMEGALDQQGGGDMKRAAAAVSIH